MAFAAPVTRRTTLAGLAGTTFLATLPWRAAAHDLSANPVFRHGVASGDPDGTSVVLWTRVTAEGTPEVRWQLAEDLAFEKIVQQGTATTGADRDYTVKLLAGGLKPGRTYYYRFQLGDAISPVGRARTLPEGPLDRLGIALASCSNYPFGFFNAYDAIARDADVDFVLHTGDYIYEYGQDGWGDDVGRAIGRRHEPAHEIVSLSDYRTRHAQYKTDAGSLAMLAAHTLLACWDDHESANNPWTGGAQNHQPETEGDWKARRAASIQAYFEWMPVREPEWLAQKGRSRMQFWRSYSFGDLATLFTLETRHTARAEQIDYLDYATTLASSDDARHLVEDVIGAPGRTMLAPELEADLSAALEQSVAGGQPWRLIGNPMPIARTNVPDVVSLGLLAQPAADASLEAQALAWKGKWNLPFYPDTWDGYEWARERLYDLSRKAGAGDLVFLTGDSHSFWANQLADGAGRPAGVELGTAGITSPGDFISSGFGPELSVKLDQAFTDHNPEVVWTDNMHQGYVRLELTRGGGEASFVAVDTILRPDYRTLVLNRFALARKDGAVVLQG
ncbi:alkaline phosphatase [Erythrobacter sp. SG61-1L]|uniref:alkaline phosphatase D family protein n=1 Tax=Erythrobacter sp. SG61-1L TaxID=1603897 RepID=UPI0006C9325E|nr:alkaline phosphatase D family protein [Erythrobacter sp. SG61-1L]KPL68584.1 alkaline phosphatase [Erythrobacter sp. SG61-1L]